MKLLISGNLFAVRRREGREGGRENVLPFVLHVVGSLRAKRCGIVDEFVEFRSEDSALRIVGTLPAEASS